MQVVLLAGGLGGARLAPALATLLGRGRLTVIANVGDDLEWMGLRVCPDLDSIVYALYQLQAFSQHCQAFFYLLRSA